MSERVPSAVFAAILVMAMNAGCSVKEDRSACPCMIVLDLSEIDESRFRYLAVRAASADGFLFQEVIGPDDFRDDFTINVPRDDVSLMFLSEVGRDGISGKMDSFETRGNYSGYPEIEVSASPFYEIIKGCECPPVWFCRADVDADAEYRRLKVGMKKNYCRITVAMVSDVPYDFELEFHGNICGYDEEGSVVEGDFFCFSDMREDGSCVVSVPRQADGSLMMSLSDGDGPAKEFALGKYIIESGYDWTSDELEDIEISIDYVKTEIIFKIRDWEKTFHFDITI